MTQLVGGLFGHVLVEPAGGSAREQNALDGTVLERPVGERVRERREQVGGVVTFTQSKNLARVVTGRSMRVFLERREESGGRITEIGEGATQLVEIRAPLAAWWTMAVEDRLAPGATRQQRVAGDTAQIGLVDEQLVLGDAHREDIGDVVVG